MVKLCALHGAADDTGGRVYRRTERRRRSQAFESSGYRGGAWNVWHHRGEAQSESRDRCRYWPGVLEVAKENAKKLGVAERYTTRPGSAFEVEFGNGYDFVLLTNIFHHFDVPTCEKLMRRVHRALKHGGQAMTLELVPNENGRAS